MNENTVEQEASRLLDTYGNSILRLSFSYVHNMEDAEEILQDTVIRVMKAAPVFESAASEKSYILTTAANLSKNRIKYNRLRAADELDETIPSEQKEDLSFVWEAVSSLPMNQQEVIHLFYQEGYSTAEIADILSRREATVRSDLHRARKKLKSILKEAYDFE